MLGGIPVIYGISPFSEESTPSHLVGTIGYTPDGRKFKYAKFGAALTAGELLQSAVEDTGEESILMAAASIGAKEVTTADSITVTANQYANGYMVATAEGGTGNGYLYRIKSHPAATAAVCTFALYEPIKIALSAATQCDFVKHPLDSVIQNPISATGAPVGVAVIATTSGYYGWIQVAGPGLVKSDASGAVTVGAIVTASNQTAGCVEDGDTDTQAIVGVAITGIAQAEFGLADLKIG